MALIPLFPDDFFFNSVRVHPTQTFSSSSAGISGDVYLFAERSKSIKKITNDLSEYHFDCLSALSYNPTFGESGFYNVRGDSNRRNISSIVSNYIEKASVMSKPTDTDKKLITYRFDIPHKFNANSIRKSVFVNNLLPFYESEYEKPMDFGFTNYHSLNFFTSSAAHPSGVPSNSALIYPVPSSILGRFPSRYYPSGSFTFEFYINPRYTTDTSGDEYQPGTILHMPNAYCVSLLSGSGVDELGRPNTFRLSLQLGDNAQIKPSLLKDPSTSAASGSLSQRIFISEDNFIKKNHWSHCAIRWGSTAFNNMTGSFFIDGSNAGNFVIDDTTAFRTNFSNVNDIPAGLIVGNWYEASNDTINNVGGSLEPGDRAIKTSFLFDDSSRELYGTESILTGSSDSSATHTLSFPLNAELQEVKIFSKFKTDQELKSSAANGYYNFDDQSFLFYLPPYFVPSSSMRRMLKTTSQTHLSSSHTPFNTDISFGQGGRSINLENFVIDMVNNVQPRCYSLEESVSAAGGDPADFDKTDHDFMPATEALYRLPQNRKRNLTILPSDLGELRPRFSILDERASSITLGESEKFFVNSKKHPYPGRVSLLGLINISETHEELSFLDDEAANPDSIASALLPDPQVAVFSSTDPATGNTTEVVREYGDVYGDQSNRIDLTILHRTKDTNSNEITFFDISNIFYGDAIKKKSFEIHDPYVSGSEGKIKLTFRDNGFGELYRCDATGSHPYWSSAGKIIYEEGLASILDPTVPPFGKSVFDVKFSGDRNIHVLEIRVPISADEAVSSSNPTFKDLRPTSLPADAGLGCNLITNMNIHDENLNVIGKVNLSRPIVRKDNDKYVFKFKIDY